MADFHRPLRSAAFLAGLTLLLTGCDTSSLTHPTGESVEIVLGITGGIAGVDYAVRVDGSERTLEGVRCTSGCDFEAGEILAGLSSAQLGELRELALEAGLPEIGDEDFGTGCCDFFAYDLRFTEGDVVARVTGDATTLPEPVTELANRVQGMAAGRFSTVMALDTDRQDWPDDRLIVHSVEETGGFLDVEVTYAGGCEPHDIDLVVFGGFLESDPVQVQAALAHDGRGDACEAAIRRELRFDLTPLHEEYDSSYPPGGPLILQLQDPGGGTPFSFQLTWRRGEG